MVDVKLNPADWLGHIGPGGRYIYDNWFDDKARYVWDDFTRGIPLVGDVLRTKDNLDFYDDYFRNRPDVGGYGGIKYHGVQLGVGSGVRNSSNFISRNIANFYDDDDYIRGMRRNKNKNKTKDVMYW